MELARLVGEARLHDAAQYLAAHPKLTQQDPRAAYLAAIVYRRLEQPDPFAAALLAGEQHGLPRSDVTFQAFLVRVQAAEVPAQEVPGRLGSGITEDQQEDVFDAMTRGCIRTFQVASADDLVQRWLTVRPKSVAARLHQARILEFSENLEGCTKALDEILKLHPGHYEASVQLATLLLVQNELRGAEQLLLRIQNENKDDPRLNLLLAQCERRDGRSEAALARLEKLPLVELSTVDRALVLKLLGQLRFDGENFSGAVKSLKQALLLAPRDAELRQSLAAALAAVGEADEAAAQRQKAKELQAAQEGLLNALREVRARPNDPDARVEQAQALWKAESKSAAIGVLRSVLATDPNHAAAKKLHEKLTSGTEEKDSATNGGNQP